MIRPLCANLCFYGAMGLVWGRLVAEAYEKMVKEDLGSEATPVEVDNGEEIFEEADH